jgi:hypothetical protein
MSANATRNAALQGEAGLSKIFTCSRFVVDSRKLSELCEA